MQPIVTAASTAHQSGCVAHQAPDNGSMCRPNRPVPARPPTTSTIAVRCQVERRDPRVDEDREPPRLRPAQPPLEHRLESEQQATLQEPEEAEGDTGRRSC